MVSTKALAAIALTLIIAMPIGIGFLTAVHQEETDSWQTTSSSKISDLMLNHQTPYYGSYKGSSNNSTLLTSSGDVTLPDYVSVTSTISSLPIYTFTSDQVRAGVTAHQFNNTLSSDTVAHNVMYLKSELSAELRVIWQTGEGYEGFITTHMYSYHIGDTFTLVDVDHDTTYNGLTTWRIDVQHGSLGGSAYYYSDTLASISVDPVYIPYRMNLVNAVVNINGAITRGSFNISETTEELTINGTTIQKTSETVFQIASIDAIAVSHATPSGTYADPSEGWTVPNTSNTYRWLNSQTNQTVTFYLKPKIADGEAATIGDLRIFAQGGQVGAYLISEGSETTQMLGAYTHLQVVMSSTGYTITGLPGWPAMGTVPQTFNSVSFDKTTSPFYTVDIQATSTDWHFRVDNANIEQGTYPNTYDYTLNMQQIYPDTNIDIYINSIGVYGDYINFGGALMTVENGSVTINGQTYRLLHAHLSAWSDEGGHYSLRINGDEVATTSEPPTIFWGGEWSVTATAYKIEKVHEYVTVWHAGEFGLDKKGFAVAGLLACAAMFVALGMTGQRSGGKAGVLLLICGGAAIVFLLII